MKQNIIDFLDACEGHFSIKDERSTITHLSKRGHFLATWAEALEAYGTPASFSLGTTFTPATFSVDEKTYDRMIVEAKNNSQRRELMTKQIRYVPRSPETEYGIKDFANCFLCENVAQAVDASLYNDVTDNLVDVFKTEGNIVYLLPNRYPAAPGHSLTVPFNHDDMSARQKNDGGKPKTYIAEEGKTRGALLDRALLYLTMRALETHNLVAMRNHVLDGMSIPGHDHFHTFPEELPWVTLADRLINTREQTNQGEGIYRVGNTPWDTLLLTYGTREELVARAIPLLHRMEQDDIVFTLFLRKNTLLVGPRQRTNTYQQVGAGIPIHYFDTSTDEFLALALEKVPKKGEFPWQEYTK